MKNKNLQLILVLFLSLNNFAQTPERKFGKQEILKDLSYLYKSLNDAHYDLYAYISKEAFYDNYNRLKTSIPNDSLNTLEATTLLQKLISTVNNGHTEIDFPATSYREYAYKKGTVFPLELAFENNKNLIRKNFSDNTNIKIGQEILSINGKSMPDILAKIYPLISAERSYFKNAKIEFYSFPRLYWQAYGKQNNFEIEVKNNDLTEKHILYAIPLIDGYERKRTDIMNATMSLNFFNNTAYINPGDFGGSWEIYQKFIDSAFVQVNSKNSKNLIIDLRNNKGGDNSFSDYLVSYIADTPFKWCSELTIKTSQFLKDHTRKNNDTISTYFQNILKHKNGERYSYKFEKYQPQPKNKKYGGTTYVLVNRQSHSQSALTAAQIQDYKFGTIVGEETGDYPTLYASQFQYSLPITGIVVKVAKGYIIRVNGSKKQEGVIPDILIKDHLLDESDEILDGILKKLNE